jgi:hypothetical protein
VSFCYFVYHQYPIADYLEYPALLVQSVFLICLHFWLENPEEKPVANPENNPKPNWSRNHFAFLISLYVATVAVLSSPSITPHSVIVFLMVRLSKPGGLNSWDQSRSRFLDLSRATFEKCQDYPECRDKIIFFLGRDF